MKRSVRHYYDSFGWDKDESGRYRDQSEDTRAVVAAYWARANARAGRFLPGGRRLLDAGCGPILRPQQRELYETFDLPVCVDFSAAAIKEARQKVGSRVGFVQADVTMLPFRAGTFDAVLSSHVLYHIPASEQANAIFDLYRVLARGGTCVILYGFGTSTLATLAPGIAAGLRRLRRAAAKAKALISRPANQAPVRSARPAPSSDALIAEPAAAPPIYFYAHDWEWLQHTLPSGWDVEIRSWASLDAETTWRLFRDTAASRRALATVSWLEERLPTLMARLGAYPMIILRKPAMATGNGHEPESRLADDDRSQRRADADLTAAQKSVMRSSDGS